MHVRNNKILNWQLAFIFTVSGGWRETKNSPGVKQTTYSRKKYSKLNKKSRCYQSDKNNCLFLKNHNFCWKFYQLYVDFYFYVIFILIFDYFWLYICFNCIYVKTDVYHDEPLIRLGACFSWINHMHDLTLLLLIFSSPELKA